MERWTEANCMRLNKAKSHVLHLDHNNSMQHHRLEKECLGSCLVERDWGLQIDRRLNMSQHVTGWFKKTSGILSCIKNNADSRTKAVLVIVHLTLVRSQLKYCVQFWAPHYKKHPELLEHAQRRAKTLVKSLECKSGGDWLQKLEVFNLAKRRKRGDFITL
ncbi:hypothetical protein TURU_104933 [Turdus rufiventris]|nr:hypothetical protein TURU_104933 [Turdus rufiventris]